MIANGSLDNAAAFYREILVRDPQNAEALNLLATIEAQRRNPSAAIELIERAMTIQPKNAAFFANRGKILAQAQCFDDALSSYDRALEIKPDYVLALNDRALVLKELDRFEEALESIDKALALKPDLASAMLNREMLLLGLRRLTRYPPLAARALFDEFSSHYDKTMVDLLGYRGHIHVRTLANRVLPRLTPPWRILDLGTGTGLVGNAFKDLAEGGRLDGIDLAPRMIEVARARGIYDDLILGDLETFLAKPGLSYDLILSADTMVYLGDLALTFSGVVRRLVPSGYYVFACESKEGDGWEQTPANRFCHSQAYIRAEASRAGLEFIAIMDCSLRNQADQPVLGFAVALRKPDGITLPH